jgi:hypothetical protein
MASKSKCGISKLERERFLYDHGFMPDRGDNHITWEHKKLKELARKQKIECPANLLSNSAQLPWEHTIPDNPAPGTWHVAVKHAKWCQETVEAAEAAEKALAARRQLRQEFREAADEYCTWRREMRHRYKAGLDMQESRPAPVTYNQLDDMVAKLKSMRPAQRM